MNAASLAGRLSPGFFANSLGVVHITVASGICSTALIFSMVAIKDATSVVVIAVLYGYISGISEYKKSLWNLLFTRLSLRCNPGSASCRTHYTWHIWTGVSVTWVSMFTFIRFILFSSRLGVIYTFCGPLNSLVRVGKKTTDLRIVTVIRNWSSNWWIQFFFNFFVIIIIRLRSTYSWSPPF